MLLDQCLQRRGGQFLERRIHRTGRGLCRLLGIKAVGVLEVVGQRWLQDVHRGFAAICRAVGRRAGSPTGRLCRRGASSSCPRPAARCRCRGLTDRTTSGHGGHSRQSGHTPQPSGYRTSDRALRHAITLRFVESRSSAASDPAAATKSGGPRVPRHRRTAAVLVPVAGDCLGGRTQPRTVTLICPTSKPAEITSVVMTRRISRQTASASVLKSVLMSTVTSTMPSACA